MQRTRRILKTALLLLLALSLPIAAQKQAKPEKETAANLPAVIWRDPGDVATLNLTYGAGGKEHAPDPNGRYTFLKEDMNGTSPKFDVEDEQGRRWRVKLGQEPQAETAANRLLWVAGYFVDEDYYLAKLKVNGLRIMMSLVNNWDLARNNNSIYEVDGERRYLVSDVGASFGNTGNGLTRSKSVLKGYANSKFIEKVTSDYVDLVLHSRPFFLTVFDVPNYRARTRMEQVTKHIPRADAKWLGQRLARLSEEQIRDCFRTAGYTPEEVEGYSKVVQKRIAELNAL